MKFLGCAVAVAVLAAAPTQAATISLVNAGFEDGLTGWTTVGAGVTTTPTTTIETYDEVLWEIIAKDTLMAQLTPTGTPFESIEAGLGIAAGTLTDPTGNLTDAAAIYQEFSADAGDTVSMYWDYVATDYIPYNDRAFALIIGPSNSVSVLASIYGGGIQVGTSGHSGWQQFSHTFAATGIYKLAFVTTNSRDTVNPSYLFLDDEAGSCDPRCPEPPSVPEPASAALLALGGALAVARRLRR